jgi:hypothetical protein
VRVFWPTLRDNLQNGVSLDETLRQLARNAGLLARRAREAAERSHNTTPSNAAPLTVCP